MEGTRSTPSFSQNVIWAKVSKPSVCLPNAEKPTSPPYPTTDRGNTPRWTTKRKRAQDDPNQEAILSLGGPSPTKKPRLPACVNQAVVSSSFGQGEYPSIPGDPAFPSTVLSNAPERKLPPCTRTFSTAVQTLITLHKFFLKAFSLHHAHNGPRAPAEITRLLETTTKLWKKRPVRQEDVQKMLAINELSVEATAIQGKMIPHSSGPFKLVMAGSVTKVECCGKPRQTGGPMSALFDEAHLQQLFEAHVCTLNFARAQKEPPHLSFLDDENLDNFPLLIPNIGGQTAAHRAQGSQRRREMRTLSNASQFGSSKSQSYSSNPNGQNDPTKPAIVETRRQGLLERIKEKQVASKVNRKSTQEMLREHSLDRIEEVAGILRMVQQQQQRKSCNQSDIISSFLSPRTQGRQGSKVSFSLSYLSSSIKGSVKVPISNEEVEMCVRMLSEELEGSWVKWLKGNGDANTGFVVLEGEGMSGKQAYVRLLEKEF